MSFTSPRPQYLNRRRALVLFSGAVGSVIIAACSSNDSSTNSSPSLQTSDTSGSATTNSPLSDVVDGSCAVIPAETSGPYPGDGSNGPDVLQIDGVVRQDIRTSIGNATGTAEGIELTVQLTILDSASGCKPLAGAAVYLWHADSQGRYSMYSSGVENENFLRGVQVADATGKLSFTTVHPGCYDGRWPHIHFEIYRTLDDVATGNKIITTQLAFPADSCATIYESPGYESSKSNFSRASIESDMVFSDGVDNQLATMTGSVNSQLTADLTVTV